MSRIGKIPVSFSKDVKVTIDARQVLIEGKKGKLSLSLPSTVTIENKDGNLTVNTTSQSKQSRADQGTIRAHLKNMVKGVTEGHQRHLEIQGIGFRAQMKGEKFVASLGFSHPVEFDIPKEVKVALKKPTEISVEGIDIMAVGQVAANIRRLKPAEPYKGKGIRYRGEVVRRKQGKSVTK